MKSRKELAEISLQDSMVMVDRALVTLCSELPESLGLSNTPKDKMELKALRAIPCWGDLVENSRKHVILRDWMRVYCEREDQALHKDLSVSSLQKQLDQERQKAADLLKDKHQEFLPNESDHHRSLKRREKEKQRRIKEKQLQKMQKQKEKSRRSALDELDDDGRRRKPSTLVSRHHKKASVAGSSKRKRKTDSDDDDDSYSESSASSSSTGSSSVEEGSASDSDSSDVEALSDSEEDRSTRRRGPGRPKKKSKAASRSSTNKRKTKPKKMGAAPPIEDLVSSDEDTEPANDLFDTNDPDVYEVEAIRDRRAGEYGQEDQYLIKWVGYPESDNTWEPASNISKELVDEFNARPVREGEYTVDQIQDRKVVRDKRTRLKTYQYLVKWFGYDDLTWEPAENLPHNLRRKFDQKYEQRKKRRTS